MSSVRLADLLILAPEERAELAIILWESLTDEERDAALSLRGDHRVEIDRRWEEHLANPTSAVPWKEAARELNGES